MLKRILLVATLVAPFALTNVAVADDAAPAKTEKPAKKTTKKVSKKAKKAKTETKSTTGSDTAAPAPAPAE